MQKQKGFTIIELIVVIAIIAVLASIVLVNVSSYVNKAKDAAVRTNMASIARGMAVCYSDKGAYSTGTSSSCYFATADTPYIRLILTTDTRSRNGTTTDPVVTTTTTTGANYCAYAKLPSYTTATYACIDSTGLTVDIGAAGVALCTTASNPKCQ